MTGNISKKRILVIDDDNSVLVSLALLLKQSGYLVSTCIDPERALHLLALQTFDLVVQDMNFSSKTSGEEGLELLTLIKTQHPALPVLLMTAWGSIALAVKGIKIGAADFFTKPWQNGQLIELIDTTIELSISNSLIHPDRCTLDNQFDFTGIVGEHPELLKVLSTVGRVSKTKAPILILGESGTGKELIADAIHRNSPRFGKSSVKINMGAISSSLFESEMFGHVKGAFTDARIDRKGYVASADGSTLFLDEIGELSRTDQVKLLRVLQDHTYLPVGASTLQLADIRVVSATNRELSELVASGEFREDLYYRLNLITIRLPALRERRSDIPLIAKQLVSNLATEYGLGDISISPSALQWLSTQSWPGNIRQLKQILERALLLIEKQSLDLEDFMNVSHNEIGNNRPEHSTENMTLEQNERVLIESMLEQNRGNISRVAKILGLSRASLYRRLKKHKLVVDDGHLS